MMSSLFRLFLRTPFSIFFIFFATLVENFICDKVFVNHFFYFFLSPSKV